MDLYGGGITWLKSGELNDNPALAGSAETVTELALNSGTFRRNQTGDVLFAMYGATIGKVAILAEPAVTNQAVCGCTPFEGVLNSYLFFYLISQRANFHAASEGGAQPNLSKDKIVQYLFPLPPLAEQKRIVAKVDELMALCDRLEAQLKSRDEQHAALARAALARFAEAPTPASLELLFHDKFAISPADLRKTILTLAVQGRLVPQDPNDEPASDLLDRIDAAPKRAMRTRATDEDEPGELADMEPLFDLPPGWEWAPFRRLALQASVGIDRGRSMQGPDKAVAYFKMNNIRNSGGVDLSNLTRIDASPDEIEAFALTDGDFLFNTRNSRELVGKTCVFRAPSDDPVLYNNNILRVRFIDGFSPDFLDFWFRSPEGSAELEKLKSNTTNVCAIYQGKLSGFPCVVPPLPEQRSIVAKVDHLMALVDKLETQLTASRTTADHLLSALVAEFTD
jgi:type I restriction enzyme S subunit